MKNNLNVLITGGTGTLGNAITHFLLAKGYNVSFLSRQKSNTWSNVKMYQWNVESGFIEDGAIENADYIIHLAGANVGESRWTEERKKLILESRVNSTWLLVNALKSKQHKVKALISASGISIYGNDTGKDWVREDSILPTSHDFLAQVASEWESEADKAQELVRLVKLRIGVVLSKVGGALEKMATPVRYYTGAVLGSGHQYISWIHEDDIANIFIKAIEDDTMQGAYNAVAPNPITNAEMMRDIAKILHKPLLPVPVPAFALKLALGEMADLVVGGNKISSEKLQKQGFNFQYTHVFHALNDLLVP